MSTNVRIIFIIPEEYDNENQCSEVMQSAFQACKGNSMNVEWIRDGNSFTEAELQKTEFVVFDKFEGSCYEKIKDSKASRIVGAYCLLICLTDGRPVPNFSWPVFNMAMSDCVVCTSHINKSKRDCLKEKIQLMGGKFTEGLFEPNTHLITDSVKTEKYVKAAELGLKIMLPDWVDVVWELSQTENVHCNDQRFKTYSCPTFKNLKISTTGFTNMEEREKLKRLITENGGTYSGQLHCATTDILICNGPTTSDKYKVARKTNKIKCVSYDWLLDSVRNGYALKVEEYTIKKPTSTPTKNRENINPDFSVMSAISSVTPYLSVLQETVNLSISNSNSSLSQTRKRRSSTLNDVNDIIDGIDIKSVKQAGSFLDGCCVFIAGFSPDQREKVSRILNLGGATRYDQLSDRITHIIVGDPTLNDARALYKKHSAPVVSLEWLCECIRTQSVVQEDEYIVNLQTRASPNVTDSPISQKGLKLLRCGLSKEISNSEDKKEKTTTNPTDDFNDINSEILQQYLNPALTNQEDTIAQFLQNNHFNSKQIDDKSSTLKESDKTQSSRKVLIAGNPSNISVSETEDDLTEQPTFFKRIKVAVALFDEDQMGMIRNCIEEKGGETISINNDDELARLNLNDVDFIVVPAFIYKNLKKNYKKICDVASRDAKIVTEFFITDCNQNLEIVSIEYYHKPVILKNITEDNSENGPLHGKVVTISSYSGTERCFLADLVDRLGAIYQEQLCRVNRKDILASTHLINPIAEGKKYEAAVKWGLPVITKDWLLDCCKSGKLKWEGNYLVGSSKAPPKPIESESDSDVSSESEIESNNDSELELKSPNKLKENVDTNIQKNLINKICEDSPQVPSEITPFKDIAKRFEGDLKKGVINKICEDSPQASSQITPVKDIVKRFEGDLKINLSALTPPLPKLYNEVDTPETPYGNFLKSNPSPRLRKQCLQWINSLPYTKPKPLSTPFSELKRRLWKKILHEDETPKKIPQPNFESTPEGTTDEINLSSILNKNETQEESNDTPRKALINSNLDKLQRKISMSNNQNSLIRKKSNFNQESCSESVTEIKNSQAGTVGWEEYSQKEKKQEQIPTPVFMLSTIENELRKNLIKQIGELGGKVSTLPFYDPDGTHLLAPKPQRTEKMLSCIAAGKWILHPSYIEACTKENRFLNCEPFEYGNPSANKDITVQFDKDKKLWMEPLHYWRVEVAKRGYGAFHDMRAIIFAAKRDAMVRIIEAGGGMVVNATAPFEDNIYATHCLIDPKIVTDFSSFIPLAKQGIFCVNITFISDFLYRNVRDDRDACLPELAKYYQD
ncbi:DNA topoisomerase 2-binding protein 1-like isoform X1 [Onthophagus taurus]|uniref:DNA topoisomerase 2-binding protein 1-like isoform X1 n=1 Tax=Onthophagus taurus TaxID=166361 RepID=UPI0039BE0714